jgi:hypothetical protein
VTTLPTTHSVEPVFSGCSVAECIVGENSSGFLPLPANYSVVQWSEFLATDPEAPG